MESFLFPPLTPLSSLLLLPPTPSPLLALLRGCRGGGAGATARAARGGRGRSPFPEGPGWRAERSWAVGARGRGAAGSPDAAREERGEGAGSSHLQRRKINTGGDGGRRRGGSAALPGSAAATGAWRRREAAAAALGVSLSIVPSSASDSSGRRDSPQRAEKRLLVALSHRGRVSPFWGCPWFRVWCMCAPVRACVSACLSARRSRPRAVHPKHRHPSSPPTPLPLPAPPHPPPPANIESWCYLGIGRRRALSSPPLPGPADPAARRDGRQRPTWQEIKHQ